MGADGPDLKTAAREAWLWGLPLIETAQQRSDRAREGVAPNIYQHQRALIDARDSFVTTPNNDTLYSQAWIDLDAGPVTLILPKSGARYFSLALMDMYTNNFAILGTRTTGGDGGAFTLVGPLAATSDRSAIRSPTRWVWALGRTLVEGQHDLAAAAAIQDQLRIVGPAAKGAIAAHAPRSAPWSEYFASVQALANENPPPATDAAVLRRMAPIIQPGAAFDATRFSAAEVAQIEAGMVETREAMSSLRRGVNAVNGWQVSGADLGAFNQNYLQRAATALGGLAALPRAEAMYYSARGLGGGFDSSRNWRLTFGPDQLPPVDSFWSLSLYRRTPAGQLYFVDNPINRYAVGDRTPGLRRGADGSLSIWLTRADPRGDASANWLPTPKGENFVLTLRAYFPRRDMLDGQYRVPAVAEIPA